MSAVWRLDRRDLPALVVSDRRGMRSRGVDRKEIEGLVVEALGPLRQTLADNAGRVTPRIVDCKQFGHASIPNIKSRPTRTA